MGTLSYPINSLVIVIKIFKEDLNRYWFHMPTEYIKWYFIVMS